MTSNAVDEQHTRGWKELQSMLKGARWGHGCCEIDEHRMIILGGEDDDNFLSSGFVYDTRTEQLSPLPNDIPAALRNFSAMTNERYMYVIGGEDADWRAVNTVYRLSLDTYQWTTLAPMGTTRYGCAAVLLDGYLYIFGGCDGDRDLSSVERYSIAGNTWEDIPDMAAARCSHCAVAAMRNIIYILGGDYSRGLEVFDITLLEWRTEASLCDMPELRKYTAAVVLKNRYLVVIGGRDKDFDSSAGCLIYDCSINGWSSTPACVNMITARLGHTAAVLDGKIIVAGGDNGYSLSSMEWIDTRDILEYAPLNYPLPVEYFNQILQLGKALLVTRYT